MNVTPTTRLLTAGACAAFCLVAATQADTNDRFFDSPWIGYDTGIYPEGLFPLSSETADLNADGFPDLATVSWGGTAYLSILFGDGKGGFQPPTTYPLVLESLDLVIADIDRDGDPDIVTSDTGRRWEGLSVSVYRNNGAGVFTFTGSWNMGNSGPSGITAADLNGDGWIDVATANDRYISFNNTVSVLMNNGAGSFVPAHVYTIDGGTREIDSADVDNDGDVDLVIAHETNKFTIMRNSGGGSFIADPAIPGINAGSIPEFPTVHLNDIDLDGDQDILYSNQDSGGFGAGAIGLWRNTGGTFGPPEKLSFNWYNGGAGDINTGDVTGDGWPDIFCATGGYGNWFLFESNGAGQFRAARKLRAGHSPSSIDLADLDQDGDLDPIVLATGSLEACVYLNPGDGSFVQPAVLDFANPNIAPAFTTNIEAGDIDADGDLDLVVGFRSDFENSFGLTVRRNNGDGTFAPRETYSEVVFPESIKLADMDSDGDLDLLCVDGDGRFFIRKNDGTGDFTTRRARHGFGLIDNKKVDAVDIDSDGDLDVTLNAGFVILVSRNLGGDNYAAPYTAADLGGWGTAYGFGDFNADGMLDLLSNSAPQGFAQIAFGTGNGFFAPPQTVSTGRGVRSFGVGDVDHDGNLDFAAIYNLDEKGVSVRRGRGGGNFFLANHLHGSFQWGDYTLHGRTNLVDVDGDGFEDILFANVDAQDFSFWRSNGDGTFQNLVRYGAGHNVHDLIVADFNGDGLQDAAMSTQVDAGRYWYTAVVIIEGKNPGGSVSQPATLTDVTRTLGIHVSGGVPELLASDDTYYVLQSGPGFDPSEPHPARADFGFDAGGFAATTLDLTVEEKANIGGPTAVTLLRNWTTGQWDELARHALSPADQAFETVGIGGSDYINGSNRLEVRVRTFAILVLDPSVRGIFSHDFIRVDLNQ